MVTTSTTAAELAERYLRVRSFSDSLVAPLTAEDCTVQSMPDTSPTRWHLAHTTWFFETFILAQQPGYEPFDQEFTYLFNSYYNSVGTQFPRPNRGLVSRPGLARVKEYRAYVDEQMQQLFSVGDANELQPGLLEIGLNHEQQHQELILTDIKHVLSCNPMLPAYVEQSFAATASGSPSWQCCPEKVAQFGHASDQFCFDNELPCHQALLHDHELADQTVTCGEFIQFIDAGGYQNPKYWLSLGWTTAQSEAWDAPLYWVKQDEQWMVFTLAGLVPVNEDWPVCHVSYFEADAFARWHGSRLPTEFEWEHAAADSVSTSTTLRGQFADHLKADGDTIHPTQAMGADGQRNFFGGVWEWTSSSYAAYPGYCPPAGALGEYNGKFMCNQYVLRGGSVASSHDHIRPTYRNFFPPSARWQFSGIRLAR